VRPFSGGLAACVACGLVGGYGRVASAQSAPSEPISEQPLGAALDLDPGATCLEQNRLAAEVQTWLGRDRVHGDVHVHVHGGDSDPRAVEFRILRHGTARERRFDALPEGCEDATAVVGLAIALAIDANAAEGIIAPTGDAKATSRTVLVAGQVTTAFDVLPGLSLGAAAGIEYRAIDWLSPRLDLLGQISWNNAIENTAGVFDVGVVALAPQICAGGNIGARSRFELCSGAAVGVVHAQGRGYAMSRSSTGPWVVASGGLRLLFVVGIPWALDVDGVFPIHVPAFRAEDAQGQAAFREPSPAGGLLSLGPSITF
jgi:hypothetical protein